MTAPFRFARAGRSRATTLTLAAAYLLIFAVWALLDAHPLILAALAVPTLPALADLWRNPQAVTCLDHDHLRWRDGRRQAEVALAEIDHLRMDTRLDLSVRTTVVLTSGERLRIPPAAQPPHRDFEQALTARRVAVRRHHFTAL